MRKILFSVGYWAFCDSHDRDLTSFVHFVQSTQISLWKTCSNLRDYYRFSSFLKGNKFFLRINLKRVGFLFYRNLPPKVKFVKILLVSEACKKFEIVKECGEPQNYGGFSSPPQAAKNVRANLRIVHK